MLQLPTAFSGLGSPEVVVLTDCIIELGARPFQLLYLSPPVPANFCCFSSFRVYIGTEEKVESESG